MPTPYEQIRTLSNQNSPPSVLLCGPGAKLQIEEVLNLCREWSGTAPADWSQEQIVMSQTPDDNKVSIKSVREQLSLSPGGRQAVVLNFDGAGVEVQNSLLKKVEEPPDRTWIILIASSRNTVLPTILSRCQVIHFPLQSDQELVDWSSNQGLSVTPEQIAQSRGNGILLSWIVENQQAIEAVEKRDSAVLLSCLRQQDMPSLWVSCLLEFMLTSGWHRVEEAKLLLQQGGRPESALAVALLS